jgi:glycosyltransferase involved in cell wall biosynthesis
MTEPLVSVVIPLYNAEEWIAATIRCVLEQTVDTGTLDIIVVDNGSTDRGVENARETLERGNMPFEIVATGENRGPSFARNAGWRRSRAPWIQFLDSDDLLLPDKVSLQLAAALAAPSDVAAVYSEWQSFEQRGGEQTGSEWNPVPPLRSPRLGGDTVLNLLKDENFVHTGSQLFRSAWLAKAGGFDERHWLIEDVDLNLRLSMAGGRFLHAAAGRPLFLYRRRGSSLSRHKRLDFLMGCVRNLKLAESYWRENGLATPQRTEFLLASYESLLHGLAPVDNDAFEELLGHVLSLSPEWLPSQPGMQWLSRCVGYRAAERLAIRYRQLKGRLRSATAGPAAI